MNKPTTYHICRDIKNLLEYSSPILDNVIIDNQDNYLTDKEAREYLQDLLTKGQVAIPPTHCNNFDKKTGWCMGHKPGGEQ